MKETAISAAKDAGQILLSNYRKLKFVNEKEQKDYLTNVDLESEKAIIEIIKARYPGHSILGEESGLEEKNSEYLWIIDPVDGTNNYVFGLPMVGISIALSHKNKVILGVINMPLLNKLYVTEKSKGAYLNQHKITVSKRDLGMSMILYDNQFEKTQKMIENFQKIVDPVFTTRITGCAVFDLGYIAEGCAEARIFHRAKPVDIAAGALLVEEAGGRVTNFNGDPWTVFTKDIVASNGVIHEDLLKTLS